MLKSVFVAYNGSPHATAALRLACFLAALGRGKVYVGHIIELTLEPAMTALASGAMETITIVPSLMDIEDITAYRREREQAAGQMLEQARRICEAWPVACETRILTGYFTEEVLAQARAVDLVALGQSNAPEDRRKIGRRIESLVRGSPQPVLIATAPYARPEEILIVTDGSERTVHAVVLGAELAGLAGLPVRLLTVAATRDEGEAIGQCARQYLADHQAGYTLEPVTTGGGAAERKLALQLNQRPTALVLMGAFGESRLREWLAGSPTRTILEETRNPVALFGQ